MSGPCLIYEFVVFDVNNGSSSTLDSESVKENLRLTSGAIVKCEDE